MPLRTSSHRLEQLFPLCLLWARCPVVQKVSDSLKWGLLKKLKKQSQCLMIKNLKDASLQSMKLALWKLDPHDQVAVEVAMVEAMAATVAEAAVDAENTNFKLVFETKSTRKGVFCCGR